MFSQKEASRLPVSDILAHPWMQGECATHEEIRHELNQRREAISKQKDQDKIMQKQKKSRRKSNQISRDFPDDLVVKPFFASTAKSTVFYTSDQPAEVLNEIERMLEKESLNYKQDDFKYKLTYEKKDK